MGTFNKSFKRELGKNTGKWVSNKVFGDGHATPHKLIVQKEEIRREREKLQEFKKEERERRRLEREERQAELEAKREQRKLERLEKAQRLEQERQEKEAQLKEAQDEVEKYEDYLVAIQSFHKVCSEDFDWVEEEPTLYGCFYSTFRSYRETLSSIELDLWETDVKRGEHILGFEWGEVISLFDLKEYDEDVYNALTDKGNITFEGVEESKRPMEHDVALRSKIFVSFDSDFFSKYYNDEESLDSRIEELKDEESLLLDKCDEYKSLVEEAEDLLNSYSENFLTKFFRKRDIADTEKRLSLFKSELANVKSKIDSIRYRRDGLRELLNFKACYDYYFTLVNVFDSIWNESLSKFHGERTVYEISSAVLSGSAAGKKNAVSYFEPFDFSDEIGTFLELDFVKDVGVLTLVVHGSDVVPDSELSVSRGQIKEKPMSPTKFNTIYQDFVCSAALRLAREYFAFFTKDSTVLVNVKGDIFNSSTGNNEEKTILSVLFEYDKMNSLNFSRLDPSDSISIFKSSMKFKKTEGFIEVKELSLKGVENPARA